MNDRNDNQEIVNAMISHYGNPRLKLPSRITFRKESEDCYSMLLDSVSIQERNMQVDDNAFEGWALAAYVAKNCGIKIILDVFGEFKYEQYEKHGHLGRFLYRAYRFSEQYEWFSLSEYLLEETDKYMKYLFESEKLLNNMGGCEADVKEDHNKENLAEAKLAMPGAFKEYVNPNYGFGDNELFRQLPVGLFRNRVSESTMLFTGKKSAIDLWTWKDDEFCVIELKAKNKMVGIVTEIFFYANYMKDLLLANGIFTLNENSEETVENDRGYSKLLGLSVNCITGMMLTDIYHPLINQEVIAAMNDNTIDTIKYVMASYDFEKLTNEK